MPRHLTVASTFGVGIPAFFLALAPSSGPWTSAGFLRGVMRFALPAGASLAAGILLAYYSALDGFGTSVAEARTASTTVLFAGMLGMLWLLERSRGRRRGPVVLLLALMITGYATVIALPAGRRAFELVLPTFPLVVTAVTGVLVALGMAWFALRLMWRTSDAASSRQA